MLVDAAKHGDTEIPVFCYEPKLGAPVGACRMCLVEIEGIPKLQTGCSTPVKDGMVVHTQTQRVHDAQRAVVEFLLINHPLDCPVCDKGGECPLQDITYGWGPGTSRFIEPKRHFRKPLELSPLIAIDRERCILCYRCVRFSQEISEDYQLILSERGAHSYVSTFDGHPYVAPFSGNIVELCPVGALTSTAYRFRARPWDIEGAGTICLQCPGQCNVELTVRDDRVLRVLARDHDEVDDGWLCDKGRFAYQSATVDERITQPLVREGGTLMPASWDKALDAAASALKKAGGKAAALAAGETTNEEAFLVQRLLREGLGSGHLSARPAGELPRELGLALADPALQATVPDLEFAHAVLAIDCEPIDDAPILDLRLRKGIRRQRRPPRRRLGAPVGPGPERRDRAALRARRRRGAARRPGRGARRRRGHARRRRDRRGLQRRGRPRPRPLPRGRRHGRRDPLRRAARLGRARRAGRAGAAQPGHGARRRRPRRRRAARAPQLRERPRPARGRLRRHARAGLRRRGGRRARRRRHRRRPRRRHALDALPAARRPAAHPPGPRPLGGGARRGAARDRARVVPDRDGPRARDRRLPGRGVPGEGGHDGASGRARAARPPRRRPPRPDGAAPGAGVRAGWQVIADVARRAGLDLGVQAGPMASRQLFDAVPFFAGLTLDAIGGRGIRWPATEAAAALARRALDARRRCPCPRSPARPTARCCGWAPGARMWADEEVDHAPVLRFMRAHAARRARRPSTPSASACTTASPSRSRRTAPASAAPRRLRAAIPPGSVFLVERHDGGAREPADRRRSSRSRAPACPPAPAWRTARDHRLRRGRLLRALVDPAAQGGR